MVAQLLSCCSFAEWKGISSWRPEANSGRFRACVVHNLYNPCSQITTICARDCISRICYTSTSLLFYSRGLVLLFPLLHITRYCWTLKNHSKRKISSLKKISTFDCGQSIHSLLVLFFHTPLLFHLSPNLGKIASCKTKWLPGSLNWHFFCWESHLFWKWGTREGGKSQMGCDVTSALHEHLTLYWENLKGVWLRFKALSILHSCSKEAVKELWEMEAESITEKKKSLQRSIHLKGRWEYGSWTFSSVPGVMRKLVESGQQKSTKTSISISQMSGSAYGIGQAFGQTLYICSFIICCCVNNCRFVSVRAKRMSLCVSLLASWWVFKEFREASALNNIKIIKIWNEGLDPKKQGNPKIFLGKIYWGLPSGLAR